MPAPKGQQAQGGTRIAALHMQRGITQEAFPAAGIPALDIPIGGARPH